MQEAVAKENFGKESENKIWVDFERPVEERACRGFLSALRKQLIEWEFPKECLKTVFDSGVLEVEGEPVVKVHVDKSGFQVSWVDQKWATWEGLQNSSELPAMIQKAKSKIADNRAKKTKGSGKGPAQ